jgi:hypothetical protein
MRKRLYPGRLPPEQWLKLTIPERKLLVDRAGSDLLGLWRSCGKKPCRRAHACCGDERCKSRPYAADFNNPNFGQPDFEFSFCYPTHLRLPSAIINQLPYRRGAPPVEDILQDCAAEAGAAAAAALRLVFRLQRRRSGRSAGHR